MQIRRNGNLTFRNGTRSLWDGIEIAADAVLNILAGAGVFTYQTINEGSIQGDGKIYIHRDFKPVGGVVGVDVVVIYYPKDSFILPVIFGTLHNPPPPDNTQGGELT
jgi:hypothetical protein